MTWITWPFRLIWFVIWFAGRLLATNAEVVLDVAVRRQKSTPIVVAYKTQCDSDLEVAMFAIMISLTPGTLMLATRDAPHAPGDDPHHGHSGSRMYVHSMYADSVEDALASLHHEETALLKAIRREGAPQ